MHADSLSGVQMLGIIVIVALCVLGFYLQTKREEKTSSSRSEQDDRKEADRIRRIRDRQLNHGRRVYNWLCRLGFPENISIQKIEDNVGRFSIYINRVDKEGYSKVHAIAQLDYDFVNEPDHGFQGHVHYGTYGADAWFKVLQHADFNFGLNDLVVKHVEWEIK